MVSAVHAGLLRADLITTRSKLDMRSHELMAEEDGLFAYCDKRQANIAHKATAEPLPRGSLGRGVDELRSTAQKLPQDHKKVDETRPVIEVARLLVRACDAGYLRSLEAFTVAPDTGELRKKQM